jgi:methylmalonyl-CoA mutase N-terminal domain/subunit
MRDRIQAKDPNSWRLRFHTHTAGSTFTAQQPENNVVRVALQAMASVLGGTQSLHTNSRDEALALPTQEAVTIALRTQQIIAYESGVADTIDPLAGAYFIEELTDELERKAEQYISDIDDLGGMLTAIDTGYVQQEIQEAAFEYQKSLERGEEILVGVNRFVESVDTSIQLLQVDPSTEADQRHRLFQLRSQRDNGKVSALRLQLGKTAGSDENLMPIIIECVENKVTLGEICSTLRSIWGEYDPVYKL